MGETLISTVTVGNCTGGFEGRVCGSQSRQGYRLRERDTMQITITIAAEDIRNYDIAKGWTDAQVATFIERWQASITDRVSDVLVGPGGILDDYMSDPDCISWIN